MEIDRSNFWEKLPTILKTISEAQYVAVDLEMSGIEVVKSRTMPVPIKPTLQEAYDDARLAAETYTILQFGFTCISWDPDQMSYVLKTFNIPLHPGVIGDNAASKPFTGVVDRQFKMSTKTLSFLESTGFKFLDVLNKGVPYLAITEVAQQATFDYIDGKRRPERLIDVTELPKRSIEFRNDVKAKIMNWRNGSQLEPVRIHNPQDGRLNGWQKRLVHDLLQDQFPELQAVARYGGAYMEILDSSGQISHITKTKRVQTIRKHIGARTLWDAICGRPFIDNIDLRLLLHGGEDPIKVHHVKAELMEYERRLKNKGPIVVGHNILMDLCFLHRRFLGGLPKSLQEFRALTREMIPRIVDTKYLFTRGGDEMSPDYSLARCFTAVVSQERPALFTEPSHGYSKPCPHQAGYDSYLTAVVFLKKSYQLSQTREGLWYIPSEDLGEEEALRSRSASFSSPKPISLQASLSLLRARDQMPFPTLPPMPDVPQVPRVPLEFRANMAKHRPASPGNLLEERDEEVVAALAKFGVMQPEGRPAAPATAPPTPEQSPDPKPMRSSKTAARDPGTIPEWGGRFWSKYGNRSRVGQFGNILYIGKMAGEQMPWEADKEELGMQMLLVLAGLKPDKDEKQQDDDFSRYLSS